MIVSVDAGKRRIALALAHEEPAESEAYPKDAAKKGGGFGLTLGEVLNRPPKR